MNYPENLNAQTARDKVLEVKGFSIGDICNRALEGVWDAASLGETECYLDPMLKNVTLEFNILSEFLERRGFNTYRIGDVIVIQW